MGRDHEGMAFRRDGEGRPDTATAWTELEGFVLSEMSPTREAKTVVYLYICIQARSCRSQTRRDRGGVVGTRGGSGQSLFNWAWNSVLQDGDVLEMSCTAVWM